MDLMALPGRIRRPLSHKLLEEETPVQ